MRKRFGLLTITLGMISTMSWAQAVVEYGATTAKTGSATAAASSKVSSARSASMRNLGKRLEQATSGNPTGAQAASTTAPSGAKVIELPRSSAGGKQASPQKQTPAVFVLANGQRREARTYTITKDFVSLTTPDGASERIPLQNVDKAATLAANKERGISINFPGANEITLSF